MIQPPSAPDSGATVQKGEESTENFSSRIKKVYTDVLAYKYLYSESVALLVTASIFQFVFGDVFSIFKSFGLSEIAWCESGTTLMS